MNGAARSVKNTAKNIALLLLVLLLAVLCGLNWLTGLSVLGHLHGGGSKMHITKTASSAFKNDLPLVILRHISNNLAGFKILNHSSFRHLYN